MLTPQISNQMTNLVTTETLPSKTYKINNNIVTREIELDDPSEIAITDETAELNNLAYDKIKLNFYGNSTQETRSGKNLFNVFDWKTQPSNVTVDSDGWITATYDNTSGTSTKYIGYRHNVNSNIKTSTTYAIFVEIKSFEGNGVLIAVDRWGAFQTAYTLNLSNITANTIYKGTSTTKADISSVSIDSSSIAVSASSKITITYRMSILEDTSTTVDDFTYEPYGVMPSPDYPSSIESVEEINEVIENKNLFDVDKVNNLAFSNTIVTNTDYRGYYFKVEQGEKYTISRKNTTGNNRFRIGYTKELPAVGVNFYNESEVKESYIEATSLTEITVTVPSFAKYLFLYLSNANENITNDLEIMIEKGTSKTDYVEHEETTITIPLQKPFRSVNGTRDTFEYKDGKWYERHNIGEITFDGSEDWNAGNLQGTHYSFFIRTNVVKLNTNNEIIAISDMFKGYIPNDVINYDNIGIASRPSSSGQGFYIRSNLTTAGTESFKTWLASNNVTVDYIAKDPEYIECTDEQTEILEKIQDLDVTYEPLYIFSNNETTSPYAVINYWTADDLIDNTVESDRTVGFVDKLDAMKQAITHILMTERYAYPIYDDNYGVELEQYIGKDLEYINATIEKTLYEALTHDLRITNVVVNSITQQEQSDIVLIDFTVTTIYGNLTMEVDVNV